MNKPSSVGSGAITPLHLAASQGNVQSIQLLLQHGADINMMAGEGAFSLSSMQLMWFFYLFFAG